MNLIGTQSNLLGMKHHKNSSDNIIHPEEEPDKERDFNEKRNGDRPIKV